MLTTGREQFKNYVVPIEKMGILFEGISVAQIMPNIKVQKINSF